MVCLLYLIPDLLMVVRVDQRPPSWYQLAVFSTVMQGCSSCCCLMFHICIKSPCSVDTGKKGNYSKHNEDTYLRNRCAHACFCLCVVQQSTGV